MRGEFRNCAILLLVALSAMSGCASQKIASTEGPLTPYSPALAAATPPSAPHAEDGPRVTAVGTKDPYRYNPGSVDPRLLSQDEPEQTFWDRMNEKTSPKAIGTKFKELTGRGADEEVARHHYNEADLAFREGDYEGAIKHYKKAADRWPDSSLEEDALFMAGESYFQMNRYPKASDMYRKLVKKYENSRYLDMIVKRRFAIGRYWEQRSKDDPVGVFNFKDKSMPFWDTVGNTVAVYESIRMDDPTGPLADDATMATANVYFLNGRWEDAAYHYDLVRTEFPQSDFQPQAHLLGMKAKLESYQGPHYDAKPLVDAKKLGNSIQTQFMAQMPNERENIQKTLKSIDAQLAERDYALGEYYYETHHFTAARYYYNEVVKNHPQSQFADLARTRIDEVKDKPLDAKNEIEWLARQFRREPEATPPTEADPKAAPQDRPALAGGGAAPPGYGQPTYGQPAGTAPPPGMAPAVPSVARQPQDQR